MTKLTTDAELFNPLKSERSKSLNDGVYVYFHEPRMVELMYSNVDAADFLFANGGFTEKRFELLSYTTGNKLNEDSSAFLAPCTELPSSETQGVGILDVQGKSFANLPMQAGRYIHRRALESELLATLMDERHPVITLAGRGGIGKTSLALSVLHEVAELARFMAILWFSARDIDLLPEGPKRVKPHVLTEKDVADELVRLTQPSEASGIGFKPLTYLQQTLGESALGPLLFVFDNFETVSYPADLYSWLDTYVRLPNKILITTRRREFKGDYYIDVLGMTEPECYELIENTAAYLGISRLLTDDYRRDLYRESDGHPYVIKILLGEVAKAGKLLKVERIVASSNEVVDALFERTFSNLSPAAKRVFLTLCNWRSNVPAVALEAVLLRADNEKMNVQEGVEELVQSSMAELVKSDDDQMDVVSVPLVASVFGKRKLAVSPMKSAVQADTAILHEFGAAQPTGVPNGIGPRVQRMFRHVASQVSERRERLAEHLPMLEFIARKYPPAWLLLSSLHEESGMPEGLERAKDAIRRFLETEPADADRPGAWSKLASLCRETADWGGEAHALLEMAQLPATQFTIVSNAADRLNALFRQQCLPLDSVEKEIVVWRLVEVMKKRIGEGDATDCSRLGWLCVHLHDSDQAKHFAELGLSLDHSNFHCQRLRAKLN